MDNIEIKSERFLQRTLTDRDATIEYLNWLNEDVVKQFITYAKQSRSLEELRHYIAEKNNHKSTVFLGIFLKNNGKHIGNIKYEPVDCLNKFAVMGILIGDEEWRGKGVGPEVIQASAKWLQQERGIKQIVLGVNVENENAISSYQKIGFVIQQTQFIDINSKGHTSMVWHL